jgi:hypothetical protein
MQPLQSVNYHDSRAHGHERHGPFTRLVGIFSWDFLVGISGWDLWLGWIWSIWLWCAAGVKPGCMFGYRRDAWEH